MRVGIIELLLDTVALSPTDRVFGRFFKRQLSSIMPQAIAVWCRRAGHEVFYATYYGQADPKGLLPDDLDVVFVATCTQSSPLACALAKLYRRDGALTVIGGPHAKAFPHSCLPFFDLVVTDCDGELIADILAGRFDPPSILSSNRVLTEFPSVRERMPEIRVASASKAGDSIGGTIAILASIGCPYGCDFCTDWDSRYIALPSDQIAADLRYIADHHPRALIGYHDPNFAVRFDETMDIIESNPAERRNRYVMESSLSILKDDRLHRLRQTNCLFVAPGVESFSGYANKAGAGARQGWEKLNTVANHFIRLREFVPGLQANFIFGTDLDEGREPAELIIDFMHRLPFVWPGVNIPTPFGGTPLHDQLEAEGRILGSMPVAFYFAPYLVTTLKNYEPAEYYDLLIEIYMAMTSQKALLTRLTMRVPAIIRAMHVLRTFAMRQELAEMHRIRALLASDSQFRAFHDGRSGTLPAFYHRRFEQRLGRYAHLLPPEERTPVPPPEPLRRQQAAKPVAA
jgi:hypothetical protein